jgi:hypothetical protein
MIEPGHQRQRRRRQFRAVEHVMHARHGQRRRLIDVPDARGSMRAGHQRDVLGVGQVDVGNEAALAGDKAAVLAHAAIGRDETEFARRIHLRSSAGRLLPRMRSAASAMASTICA